MKNFRVHFVREGDLIVAAESEDDLLDQLNQLTTDETSNLLRDTRWETTEIESDLPEINAQRAHSVLWNGMFLHPHDVPVTQPADNAAQEKKP